MLKKFKVKNFKNFGEEIILDFSDVGGYKFSTDCITNNMISKMIIYGKNATGKTNLGKALLDITDNFRTAIYLRDSGRAYTNADSINSEAFFSYEFMFGEQTLIYNYSKAASNIMKTEQLYVDNELIFGGDFEKKKFTFENLKLVGADSVVVSNYIDALKSEGEELGQEVRTLPFIRWLISNSALEQDNILLRLSDYVKRMVMISVGSGMIYSRNANEQFYEFLTEDGRLQDFEDFLNKMGIECKLLLEKLPDGGHELYFKHQNIPLPFVQNASSGTLALVRLYQRIASAYKASFLYMDEFDAFYNYELAENVVKILKEKYADCQVILTSHNTNLMSNRLMRPDCLFIISKYGLTPLSKATERELREGHNLEKMYIGGEFKEYE